MARLDDNLEIINSNDCDPTTQRIIIPREPDKWAVYTRNNQIVRDVYYALPLEQDKTTRVIKREDLRVGTPQERVVKALLWAFIERPNGAPSERIINQLSSIAETFQHFSEMPLNLNHFILKYREILGNYEDMGKSTLSVLMYVFNIKSGDLRSIAITGYVDEALSYFKELRPLREADYFEQLWCIYSEALRLKVDIERLEYYLFKVGKHEIKVI